MKKATIVGGKTLQDVSSKGRPKTLQFKVYEYIKEKVINRQFKSEQYITDKEISLELNISRTPIREALSLLEYEGYLSREDRRGWRVCTLNIAEIKNIYEIKAALEGLLVKSVSENIKGNFHEKFLKVIQEMKNAANANILDAWWKADNAMYDLLFEKANNQRLCRMIKDLNDQLLKIRLGVTALEGRMLRSTLEHEEIFECIIRGDGEKAEKLQKKHTLSVYRELERVLVHLVMPFLENGV